MGQVMKGRKGEPKKCTKCGEFKLTRYFSIRKDKRKKDGSPMYYSVCHKCKREKQKTYMANKRAATEKGGVCEICNKKITHYAKRCVKHKILGVEYDKGNKKINPKFLVRGLISSHNRACMISNNV